METLFVLLAVVSLIAAAYFAVRAAICKAKKNGGAGAAVKKAGVSVVVFVVSVIIFGQMSSSEKAEQPAQETAQTAQQQTPAKEDKAAEPEQAKATKQVDTPAVYDVAADKQALTDYVNSTAGTKYKITNLNVSEYSDGVYQINIECRDKKYGDAESAKAAGREIRELMPDFPCKVNLVAITFKGGQVGYDPASSKMQIVAEGKKTEF